jgi:hypothetical protein
MSGLKSIARQIWVADDYGNEEEFEFHWDYMHHLKRGHPSMWRLTIYPGFLWKARIYYVRSLLGLPPPPQTERVT